MKLCEAWADGMYNEVGEEASKMNTSEFITFIILFIKVNGLKEIEILKKFL